MSRNPASTRIFKCCETVDCASPNCPTTSLQQHPSALERYLRIWMRAGCASALNSRASSCSARFTLGLVLCNKLIFHRHYTMKDENAMWRKVTCPVIGGPTLLAGMYGREIRWFTLVTGFRQHEGLPWPDKIRVADLLLVRLIDRRVPGSKAIDAAGDVPQRIAFANNDGAILAQWSGHWNGTVLCFSLAGHA